MKRRGFGFGGWLALVALAGFLLRLAYVLVLREPHIPFGGDPGYYTTGADLLAGGHGFVKPVALGVFHQSASHPPLYLLWLAIPSLVWNHQATQLVDLVWTCVLGTGTVVVVGLAGREIAGRRVGLIAAALAAVYPNLWVQDGMLRAESAAIFVVALILLLSYRFLHRPTLPRLLWLGVACGLAALARSELLLVVPFVLVPVVVLARGIGTRTKVGWAVAGSAVALVVITPWVAYNMSRFDTPVYLSTNSGGTVSAANCRSTYSGDLLGFKDYGCALRAWNTARRHDPRWNQRDEAQQDAAVQTEAERYVKAHLSRVPVVVAARWGRILGVYRPFQEVRYDKAVLQQEWTVGYSIVWSFWIFAVLAAAGVVVLRRRATPVWPLLALPAIVFVSVAITFAQTRYRSPAEVAVVLLAAVAIDALARWFARRRTARAGTEDDRVIDLAALEAPEPPVGAEPVGDELPVAPRPTG
ncbi:MAG TPA: glycosyltransferase family 39 protein [Acidimicrobiia bacterium]